MMQKWIGGLILVICILGVCSDTDARDVRDIVKIANDVVVEEGEHVGDAVAVGGNVTVKGTVEGDAVAVGGSVTLESRAIVEGDVVSIGGKIHKAPGAKIHNDMVEVDAPGISSFKNAMPEWHWRSWLQGFRIVTFIGFIALALLIVAIMPRQIGLISNAIESDTLKTVLWGLLGMALIVPGALLLTMSIVGIPLVPVELILVVCAAITGYIAIAQLIGKKMAIALKRTDLPIFWETFWGVFMLGIIGFVPVLGWLVKGIASLIGFGAVILTLVRIKAADL